MRIYLTTVNFRSIHLRRPGVQGVTCNSIDATFTTVCGGGWGICYLCKLIYIYTHTYYICVFLFLVLISVLLYTNQRSHQPWFFLLFSFSDIGVRGSV